MKYGTHRDPPPQVMHQGGRLLGLSPPLPPFPGYCTLGLVCPLQSAGLQKCAKKCHRDSVQAKEVIGRQHNEG
jgi:hypothetical protein